LQTAQKLLTHFGSLARVREATVEDLRAVATRTQAESIWRYFHPRE
jgi:excinuclease UvrABC nuclease subunit